MIGAATAQDPFARYEDPVPTEVEAVYVKGLQYLANSQTSEGFWTDNYGQQAGVVGLAVLAFLAHGEDPNSGPYSNMIKRGLAYIVNKQADSGYIGTSMYNHGFATLALAEAYGQVDDPRIGIALRDAVKLILSSQAKNPYGAWRYSSSTNSADTTVSGACFVALLAARNAGMQIPDRAINKALKYFQSCQSMDGGFGYTSAGSSSPERGAIGCLAFSLARATKSSSYKSALEYFRMTSPSGQHSYHYYYLYYGAQAAFRADPKIWKVWNEQNIQLLRHSQQTDGSWHGPRGAVFSTSAALLSLALNYRFLPIYER